MYNSKRVLAIIILVACSIVSVSCKKTPDIIGEWEYKTRATSYDSETNKTEEIEIKFFITFYVDGTGKVVFYNPMVNDHKSAEDNPDYFSYIISNDEITITVEQYGKYYFNYTLDEDTMTLIRDNGEEYILQKNT